MIFWRCLGPRSAGMETSLWPLVVRPTARFSRMASWAIEAATRIASSTVDTSPFAAHGPCASRSTKSQTSAVCSRSNSLTWISPRRAVLRQWMRLKLSPGAYGRTVVASGVVWRVRSGAECVPSRIGVGQSPARQRHDPREDGHDRRPAHGRRRLEEPERIARPDDHGLDAVGPAAGQRHDRDPRPLSPGAQAQSPAGQRHGQIGRVVDLQPGLGQAARVARCCRSSAGRRRRGPDGGRRDSPPRDRPGRNGSARSSRRSASRPR